MEATNYQVKASDFNYNTYSTKLQVITQGWCKTYVGYVNITRFFKDQTDQQSFVSCQCFKVLINRLCHLRRLSPCNLILHIDRPYWINGYYMHARLALFIALSKSLKTYFALSELIKDNPNGLFDYMLSDWDKMDELVDLTYLLDGVSPPDRPIRPNKYLAIYRAPINDAMYHIGLASGTDEELQKVLNDVGIAKDNLVHYLPLGAKSTPLEKILACGHVAFTNAFICNIPKGYPNIDEFINDLVAHYSLLPNGI